MLIAVFRGKNSRNCDQFRELRTIDNNEGVAQLSENQSLLMASLFIKWHASPIQEQVLFNVRLYGFSLSAKITLLQRKHLFCHQKQKYERNCFVVFLTVTNIPLLLFHFLNVMLWMSSNFQF